MIERDLGWSRIQKAIKQLDNSYAKVGVQDGSDVDSKDQRTLSEMVVIASVHEFGAPKKNIPQRSFLRSAVDTHKPQIVNLQTKAIKSIIDGSMSVQQGVELLGQYGQKIVRKQISSNIPPPLKNPSKKRGGPSAKSLVDTGQLRQSIHSVEFVHGVKI